MKIRKLLVDDLTSLKALWYECFLEHDSQASIDYYLTNYLDYDNTFVLIDDNEIKSSIVLSQHELYFNGTYENVSFITWVATLKKDRHKGYMKTIMNYAIDYASNKLKQNYMILQAYDWNLYKQFDFYEAYYKSLNIIYLDDLLSNEYIELEEVSSSLLLNIYNKYVLDLSGYKLRNEAYYDKLLPYLSIDNIQAVTTKEAYCFYTIKDNILKISECAFINKMSLLNLIKTIISQYKVNKIELLSDTYNFKTNNKELVMMVKELNKNKFNISDQNYISEYI
ncbi:MAG: GNAT family N-acetyltransferase [Bacilli bacterium]|jgi:predicted acetyltransferase|nr:GNAT family N-acetyltransferase [Bacilli bacterium]